MKDGRSGKSLINERENEKWLKTHTEWIKAVVVTRKVKWAKSQKRKIVPIHFLYVEIFDRNNYL